MAEQDLSKLTIDKPKRFPAGQAEKGSLPGFTILALAAGIFLYRLGFYRRPGQLANVTQVYPSRLSPS
jgi:hypothetical protein